MKTIQAFVLSVMSSFFAQVLLVLLNFIWTLDIVASFEGATYLLSINTLWSFVFLLVIGHGNRMSVKVFIAPLISAMFTVFTLFIIDSILVDILLLYLLLVISGILAVSVLYAYRASYGGD